MDPLGPVWDLVNFVLKTLSHGYVVTEHFEGSTKVDRCLRLLVTEDLVTTRKVNFTSKIKSSTPHPGF